MTWGNNEIKVQSKEGKYSYRNRGENYWIVPLRH